jgi:hypothetical protein
MDIFFSLSHPKHGEVQIRFSGSMDGIRWCGGALLECFEREGFGGPPVTPISEDEMRVTERSPLPSAP